MERRGVGYRSSSKPAANSNETPAAGHQGWKLLETGRQTRTAMQYEAVRRQSECKKRFKWTTDESGFDVR